MFLHIIRKSFYNNLGINALIVHFCFVLIDLINDYQKNLKIVYIMVSMTIVCIIVFYTNC